MKLYEVPKGTPIKIVEERKSKRDKREVIDFHYLDGMYSYCTNQEGEVVHLAAWTEVEIA